MKRLYNTEKDRILVISDVDGCITTGHFIYTCDGKFAKIFGVSDHEGIKLLRKNNIDVEFITADMVGYPITQKRMEELKCKCNIFSETERLDYIKSKMKEYDLVFFFGDGLGDAHVADVCKEIIFIAPKNARKDAQGAAKFVTENPGGSGAFLDCAEYICFNYIENWKDLYE